jgi:fatty-acid desaturase
VCAALTQACRCRCRWHHMHSDQPADRHSPNDGIWHAHMGWLLDESLTNTRCAAAGSSSCCPCSHSLEQGRMMPRAQHLRSAAGMCCMPTRHHATVPQPPALPHASHMPQACTPAHTLLDPQHPTHACRRDANGSMKDDLGAPWFYKESPEFYGWLRSTYMYHQLGQAALLTLWGGLPFLVWGFVIRVLFGMHMTW